MLRKPFVVLLLAALVVALLLRLPALVLLCSLVLVAVGAAHGWRRWALHGVEYERTVSDDHLFPGDEATLTMRVVNRKLLPLTRLDLFDLFPPDLPIVEARRAAYGGEGMPALHRSLSLGWYEAVTKRYRIRPTKRGVYDFGPAFLRAGDPFGFFTDERRAAARTRLVVYPALLPPEHLPLALRQFLGDARSRQRLMVDPARTVGVRDYQRDDPLKSIDWYATARRGALQTRLYEATTSLQTMCFLDVDTFEHVREGIRPEQVERLISTAATLATLLLRTKHGVGFVTNGVMVDQTALVRIEPGHSLRQAPRILETLAGLKPYSRVAMARLLRTVPQTLAAGTTVMLISAVASPATQHALLRLQQQQYAVCWICLSEHAPSLPKVPVFHLPPPSPEHERLEVPQ